MAATLQQILLAPETQPHVITDCKTLIEQEISEKSGVSGTAVKLAYKTVTSFAPGYYHDTLADMLPLMVAKLEPYWADFNTSGGSGFGDYLAKRGDEVAESLLEVTDALLALSKRAAIIKTYRGRPPARR